MKAIDIRLPHVVRAYVLEAIRTEETAEQYQQDPRLRATLRRMWDGMVANPPRRHGLDWLEVLADWQGGYVHDSKVSTYDIMRGVRELAADYAEQTYYDNCHTCGRAAWLGTDDDCSECDDSHKGNV